MIDVKCPQCKESFSVPDSLAGQMEKCLACGHFVAIPGEKPSSPKRSEWNKGIFGRKPAPKGPKGSLFDVGLVSGILLTMSGIIVTSLALNMDITGGSVKGIGDIANLDRMNQRLGWIVIGMGLFVSGIVLLGMNAIHQTIMKSRGE